MKVRLGNRLGAAAFALSNDRPSTRAWLTGARGEERLAAILKKRLPASAIILHDRRLPRSRANIDHIVVAPSGVWVVDAKNYSGKVDRRSLGPIGQRTPALFVGGRNRTADAQGMSRQLEAVRDVVGKRVPVHAVVCLVGADWPLFARPISLDGLRVLWPRKLGSLIAAGGSLSAEAVLKIADQIAARLPAAMGS